MMSGCLNSTWWGFDGDGGPVIDALITWPRGITAGPDGSVYFADADDNNRIRRIGPAGIITTVAGNGSDDEQADEEAPATAVSIGRPEDVALAPDGSLYVSDGYNYRILRVGPAVPRGGLADIRIPSQDGRQVYVFSGSGRHLRTLDALTGATLYLFTYDAQNLLTAITDAYGNNTTIERDARGTPLAVDGPYGQRTELAVDGNGYLTAITNPNGETNSFLYSEGGLLTTHSDPKGGNWAYTYGESGRLTRNDDPAGGYQTFERQDLENGYVVTRNTALGRTSTYQVTDTPTGEHRLVNSTGCCGTSEMVVNADGTRTITQADGTVKAVALGADPRFGMQAPFVRDMTVTTPGGLAMSVSRNRTVDLGNPDDPFSLSSQTDTLAINGKAYTRFFGADTLETTSTTPEGRQTRTVSDATGRVLERTLSGLATSAYSYDEQGRLTRVTHGTFPDRRTFSFGYGADGLLESLSDPLGRTTNLQRDVAGRLIAQILPDGRQIGFGYDANGNLNSVTPPGRPAHGLIRNAVNLLSDYAPPNIGILSTTTYAYNADRQLTQIHRPDNTTIEFNHQSDTGLLSSITADQGGTTYSYDPASGRLIGIDATGGQGLDLAYDGFLLTNQTWTEMISGSVDLTWNDDFRLATLSVNGSGEDLFSYDDDGLMTQAGSLTLSRNRDNGLVTATQLGGITDSIAYNEFAERINYTAGFGTTLLYDATYTRDKGGRVTSMTETIEGGTVSYQYSYDDDGRLTTVTINGDLTDIYSYDDNGNRTGHADGDGITSGTYDEQDRLLQYGDCTYNYTAAGELASKTENGQTTSFNYDALGNLRRVDLPDDTVISYVIDGLNRRWASALTAPW